MAIIGIDLGTTNSLGAVFRNGAVELIPNKYGSFLTPSVVSVMEDGSVVVGQEAKKRLLTHPERTASSFKRDMGTEKEWKLGEKSFLPEELSSFVIRSILNDARAFLGEEVTEAVISVPAYFYDEQRRATKLAGDLAGVKVERIINEPSAAALDSYYDRSKEKTFLVFDLGGGTLDVSVVNCFGSVVEIESVSGNNRLGGDDFDQIIAKSFLKEHGLKPAECTREEYEYLKKQAEQCKIALSESRETVMKAEFRGKEYESVYTSVRLAKESEDLLKEMRRVIGKALKDGDLSVSEIEDVVMVGGSSKMPLVQSYVRHLFKKKPQVDLYCDLKVARGVGLVSGVKGRSEEIKDYVLKDICPFSLGTEVYNEGDPTNSFMSVLISRNTALPCSNSGIYSTVADGQTKVMFHILQGEHAFAKDNVELGKLEIKIPANAAGKEGIRVRYTYDMNGILVVQTEVLSTGEKKQLVLSKRISGAELDEKVKELSVLMVHPRDKKENIELIERLTRLYEEGSPEEKPKINSMLGSFEKALNLQNERKIRKCRERILEYLKKKETGDPFEFGDGEEWNPEDIWEEPEDEEDPFGEEDEFPEDLWHYGKPDKWTS